VLLLANVTRARTTLAGHGQRCGRGTALRARASTALPEQWDPTWRDGLLRARSADDDIEKEV